MGAGIITIEMVLKKKKTAFCIKRMNQFLRNIYISQLHHYICIQKIYTQNSTIPFFPQIRLLDYNDMGILDSEIKQNHKPSLAAPRHENHKVACATNL